MLNGVVIASMMVCGPPNFFTGRLYLSASDAVWSPVEKIEESLVRYFTDELGNSSVEYGGFLQMIDPAVLNALAVKGFFACFRGVKKNLLEYIQVEPPVSVYKNIYSELKLMGWDIVTGNGWLSASCHGCFPVDPDTGNENDENSDKINRFGLFEKLNDCHVYCDINNRKIPEHAPWYPVGVFLDVDSFHRLVKYFEE